MAIIDWINLIYFPSFIVLSFIRRVSWKNRLRVIAMGILGLALTYAMQNVLYAYRNALLLMTLLLAYWQPAGVFVKVNSPLQQALDRFDRKYLAGFSFSNWFVQYMEFSYLFCYPFLPVCILLLWQKDHVFMDVFWNLVIPSSYPCYAMVPFLTVYPPWRFEAPKYPDPGTLRKLNFFVVRHFSNRLNTIPSAHVTASLSAAIALCMASAVAGAIAILVAISIGAGAIIGRYHYAIDVLLGALVSAGWFLIYRLVIMA